MNEVDTAYAAELANRKAFFLPAEWEWRKAHGFQHRGCSTPGCTARADWLIARNAFERGAVRYACTPCKAKKYAELEEATIA